MHTFQRRCNPGNPGAACNSAVAIKSGDDVILIDGGGPKVVAKRGLTIDLYLNGELTPGTKIVQHRGGKKFDVSIFQFTP